jgi:hypothetical protein
MLGAVEFSAPAWHGLVVLAVVWAVALPLLLRLAQIGAPEAAPIYRGLAG